MSETKSNALRGHFAYAILILALILIQYLYIRNSTGQIRHEEIGASVCGPWWLEHRTVYDGISSNVGWYAILTAVYRLFGFTLFTAKYVRLVLSLVGLLCICSLLRRWIGDALAWIPLALFGLSPTYLYFNILQTEYGLDLLYFPIVAWLLFRIRFDATPMDYMKQFLTGLLVMWACISYPSFIAYTPVMLFVYLYRMRNKIRLPDDRKKAFYRFITPVVGSIAPLAGVFLLVKTPQLLVHDARTGAGLFRGGGKISNDWDSIQNSLQTVLTDVFAYSAETAKSYYYEVPYPDFGSIPLYFVLLAGFALAVYCVFREQRYRVPFVCLLGLGILSLLSGSLSPHLPGIRRATGFLVMLYGVQLLPLIPVDGFPKWGRKVATSVLVVLLVHHLWVLPYNYSSLPEPSPWRASLWFGVEKTPDQSLRHWEEHTRQWPLVALNSDGTYREVPYSEIYAAIAGYRFWNGMPEYPIEAYDSRTQSGIVLEVHLWEKYYFSH